MKKIILGIILTLMLIPVLPSNSYSYDGRHRRHRVVIVNKWPRRHVVVVYHRRYHRHHRYYRLPPIWIPRDPWR